MADNSFQEFIQEGRRKKAAEKLAQEIFGKGRRSSAPPTAPKAGLGGSLASRVGVTKRTPSLPRSTTPRQSRPTGPSRPPAPSRPSYTQPFADRNTAAQSNGFAANESANDGGSGLNIKGAASGPYIVMAQNFQAGTTAADIESVMEQVTQVASCKLVASNPTIIAEMAFLDKAGAEKVIETFNNKKADGRVLYVYWKSGGGGLNRGNNAGKRQPSQPEPQTALGAGQSEDVAMEVNENAESREAENRRREERRGGDDRAQREVFPTGPRDQFRNDDSYYDRRPRQNYQDGRYGFGGGYRNGGGRPRYGEERRFGGGQSWRP